MPILTTSIQHNTRRHNCFAIWQEKIGKSSQIRKVEEKLSLFTDDITWSYTQKTQKIVCTHTQIIRMTKQIEQRCRTQNRHKKSTEFSNTNHKQPWKDIHKTIILTIASRRMKYLGINSTKKSKTYTLKNYKNTAGKKLKKMQIRGKVSVFTDWKT